VKRSLTESSRIKRITNARVEHVDDLLAIEDPLEIQLRYGPRDAQTSRTISVTMRTPGNDDELAVGFLFTEGIIRDVSQIREVKDATGNGVLIVLDEQEVPDLKTSERNFYTASSCGVCGKSSIDAIRISPAHQYATSEAQIKAGLLYELENRLRKQQATFSTTGGLHASALFDLNGQLMMVREDVGRHNALDKVIGAALLTGQVPLVNTILLLSGRASFELIQKAHMAGTSIIAAVGAPSSLAVRLAKETNITLVGFLRESRLNIYSGWERIII